MGFFSSFRSAARAQAEPAEVRTPKAELRPLSTERIIDWFKDNKFHYFVDNEGDLGGLWNGRLFYFFTFGRKHEVLQIRGQWNRQISILRLPEVLDACNDWNRERIWPMCYARVRDDGMVRVVAETSTDLEHGVSDAQLGQLLHCALATCNKFLDTFDQRYPDPAEQPPGQV